MFMASITSSRLRSSVAISAGVITAKMNVVVGLINN